LALKICSETYVSETGVCVSIVEIKGVHNSDNLKVIEPIVLSILKQKTNYTARQYNTTCVYIKIYESICMFRLHLTSCNQAAYNKIKKGISADDIFSMLRS
jgi:hypothetical protein